MLYLVQVRITPGPPVTVHAPYHPNWPGKARSLGGQWDAASRTWKFDPRDLERVRAALGAVYGWTGDYPVEILDARVLLDKVPSDGDALWMFGRLLAERRGRDAPVRLGQGVVLFCGGFPLSGGSRRSPRLEPYPGTTLEVRDVCATIFEARRQEWPEGIFEVPGSRRTLSGPGQEPMQAGFSEATRWPKRRIIL